MVKIWFLYVQSSVPTIALAPLVPASPLPATPKTHSASPPPPLKRSTGSDVRSLAGCHPKETLQCCWVTSVMFSNACSDGTFTGHHLLCPLLTTMLARSRSQIEWESPTESRLPLRPSTNPMWTLWRWGLWSELPQAKEEGGTSRLRQPREHGMKGYRSCDLIFNFFFFNAVIGEDEDDNWWCYGGPFRFQTTCHCRRPRLRS